MTTTIYTGSNNGRWAESTNWSNGAPAPGETAIIDSNVVLSTGDLALFRTTVDLGGGGAMAGNVLALADSSIAGPNFMGFVLQQDIIADRMSFVGIPAADTTGGLEVTAVAYLNQGTIGAEAGGSNPGLELSGRPDNSGVPSQMNLVNQGTIIASGSGELSLDANVTGTGSISISDGGVIYLGQNPANWPSFEVGHGSIAATQKVNMGGQDATTLIFDPSVSSIAATIAGFGFTDLIDLQNFQGFFVASGTKNPTLTFTSLVSGIPQGAFTLTFSGNYKGDTFSLAPDASGHGSLLMVT
jgi:hypothetical protein